jgi:outer membrane cobalamin receptor
MAIKRSSAFVRIFVPICVTVFMQNISSADDSSNPTSNITTLEEMTVTASPIIEGNYTDSYSSQKTVVTQKQIADLNAQDIATALRKTPGVNISRYNSIGSFGGAEGGGIFIRGMGSSRPGAEIKTFVDGVPMYMSVWNHPLLDLMAIDSAKFIEVYKSPQPQYFGNAFGAINIVPKKMENEGFLTQGQVAFGSNSTFITALENGGKTGAFDYYIGGGYRTSDGHRTDSDGELQNFYGRLGYDLSDHWNISIFNLLNDNYAKDPGVEGGNVTSKKGTYETRTWLSTATLSNKYKNTEGSIKFYRNKGEGDWLNNTTSTAGVYEDLYNDFLYYGIKAKQRFYLSGGSYLQGKGVLLTGIDLDYTEGSYDQDLSNGKIDKWNEHDFNILSPYTALSWTFGNSDSIYFTPSAGIRYYDNSKFESEYAPHAGLTIGYSNTQLHTGYSRGVVYPGLEVMVMSEKVIPMLKDSWKNLSAETTDHYEAGVSHKFGKFALVDVTFFYDNGHDRYVIVPPPPPPPTYSNIEKFTIQGIEASFSINPTDYLSLFSGITFLDPNPSDLPYAPDTTFSVGLNWKFLEHFRLNLDCSYLSNMYVNSQARRKGDTNANQVDSYFLANTKLSYAFIPESGKYLAEFFIAGENITNEHYEYLPGYPMPGITFMAGMNFRI